jgi:hypothetical protein
MSSGFNTDVRVGEQVYHVQTEDRGPSRPAIDTAVYQQGRVLHRRSSNYAEFAASAEFSAEDLRQRVEKQHRTVIEELRSGALTAGPPAPVEQPPVGGIQIQLLNAQAWLSAGNVSLEVEIRGRVDQQPQAGVRVEARIEGSLLNAAHEGMSDDQGRVRIQFPVPPLGKGELALVIQASGQAGRDELRFAMRSRQKVAPVSSPPGS